MFSFFPSANKASIKLKKSLAQRCGMKKHNYMDGNSTQVTIAKNEKRGKAHDTFPKLCVLIARDAFATFFIRFPNIFLDFS